MNATVIYPMKIIFLRESEYDRFMDALITTTNSFSKKLMKDDLLMICHDILLEKPEIIYLSPWPFGNDWFWDTIDLQEIKKDGCGQKVIASFPPPKKIISKSIQIQIRSCANCIHMSTCKFAEEYWKIKDLDIQSESLEKLMGKLDADHFLLMECSHYRE